MLTPIEIQDKTFKSGIGYDKKDVEAFFNDVSKNYEQLYRKNAELKEKISILSESVEQYKSMEKSLQKALVLAQSVSENAIAQANEKAKTIEKNAYLKSDEILANSKKELNKLNNKIAALKEQYNSYIIKCRHFSMAIVDMLDTYDVFTDMTDNSKDLGKSVKSTEENVDTQDFRVDIDFSDFEDPNEQTDESFEEKKVLDDSDTFEEDDAFADEKVEKRDSSIISFDDGFDEILEDGPKDKKPADDFNLGIVFSDETDSGEYYKAAASKKEEEILKEPFEDLEKDGFSFEDENEDETGSIGIDFDFLDTDKRN